MLASLCGCLPTVDLEPPARCDLFDGGLSTPAGRAVFVGREVTVITSRRAPTCPPEGGVTAQVRVLDPRSLVAPARVEGPFVRGQFHGVEVRFTPTRPGPWRVDVVFEPGLGRALNEVLAVEPLEPGQRGAFVGDDVRCALEGVTARGALVCLSSERAEISFWRAGRQLQAVPGVGFDVAGDAVFVVGPGQVERFIDVGGAFLRRVPDVPFGLEEALLPLEAFAAVDEARLLVASRRQVRALSSGDGGFSAGPGLGLPAGLCQSALRLVPVGPDGIRLACTSRVEPMGVAFTRFCRSLGDEPDACFEVRGRLVGADVDGPWVVDGQTVSLVTGPLERRSTTLPPGWTVVANARWAGSLHPLAVEPTGRVLVLRAADEPFLAGLDGAGGLVAAPPEGLFVRLAGERAWFPRSR